VQVPSPERRKKWKYSRSYMYLQTGSFGSAIT